MGLEQLDFAAGQVAVMQQQLIDLQPLLVETSDKTEKLMIKIEQDTVVVEKQKEVGCGAGAAACRVPPHRSGARRRC